MASLYQSLASRSRQTASRVWQPRNTSSIIFSKGLLNAPGENNCFLNSAVQVLWHLDVFRRSFRQMGGHACMGNACIFCALKVLFTQLRYSERQSLPPDALRKALAVAFQDEHRFQLGCMDDAAECFENILTRIHFHLARDIKEDLCDAKYCIPHRKFAMTLIEHSVCRCGATSEPFPFTQMVHYVSCTALCAEAKKLKEKHHWSNSVCFGHVLRNAGALGDIRDCPSECGRKINIRRVLMNSPDVVAIGLVWDSDRPEKDHIVDVIDCLGTSLRMPDLFNSVVDEKAKQAALHLVGVVTYYGKHYSTFFYNTALRVWVYFDDATVKQVGPNWRDVVNRCKRGHSQPLLLLFANPDGTPVPTDTAPKETTLLPGYTKMKSPTDVRSSRTHLAHDPHKASNAVKFRSLQPVVEYKPAYTIAEESLQGSKTHDKYVVEIGHDAVQKIQARRDGGHSASQDSYRGKGNYVGKTTVQANQGFDTSLKKPLPVKQPDVETHYSPGGVSSHHNYQSLHIGQNRTNAKTHGDQLHPLSDGLRSDMGYSRQGDDTSDNLSLASFQDLSVPILSAATSAAPDAPQGYNATYPLRHVADPGKPPHPKRLERHESWNGRPNPATDLAPKVSQSWLNGDKKGTVQRHNSFSHGTMSDSQYSIPVQQQDSGQMSKSTNKMLHSIANRNHEGVHYPRKESKMQFGSVPNLNQGFDLRASKSVSVQNIAMAEDGILASAVKNNLQQKRASTSDVPMGMGSSSGHRPLQVNHKQMPGMERTFVSSTGGECAENMQPFWAGQHDQSNSKHSQRTDRDHNPGSESGWNASHLELLNTDRAQSSMSNDHKTNRPSQQHMHNSSPMSGQGLRDRDSVASKDSGYRSRDRSSASSGSLHSIEAPTTTCKGLNTVGAAEKSNEEKQLDKLERDEKVLSWTQDKDTICDEVCAECAILEAQSRQKGDAGDLATALALCTASVAKLKQCLRMDGISPQKWQSLHNRYNNAVLQSRNLHRRLTLLRGLDSLPAYQNDTTPISSSQLLQTGKELDLINLDDEYDEISRVDELKQQVHKLYMQEEKFHNTAVRQGPNVQTPARVWSTDALNGKRTFEESLEAQNNHRGMTSFNRNQNADSASFISKHWLTDSLKPLRREAQRGTAYECQSYGLSKDGRDRNSASQQDLLEDPMRNSSVQQDMYRDLRRHSMTQQGTYKDLRGHGTTLQGMREDPGRHLMTQQWKHNDPRGQGRTQQGIHQDQRRHSMTHQGIHVQTDPWQNNTKTPQNKYDFTRQGDKSEPAPHSTYV
ncbi:uncharacterized protein LOC110977152 isoform X2 [Acanthaster planci]|uniref:Uncharacterized protein LOC110977152 isoform X2 n=1 Tax=Acanthaster planci TaxID=133434 RepID=A0A8B7Y178_ACAPL|nr:uncharacterized protein LOC110977152 isoform X2 [Acanthaster planci]